MPEQRDLELICQRWLKVAAASGGVPGSQLRLANQDVGRGSEPYASIRVETWDEQIGIDEPIQATHPSTGELLHTTRGDREASVVITTFGTGAAGWLRRATSKLWHPSVQAMLAEAGFVIEPSGPILNVSAVRETHTEPQAQREFLVRYVQCSTLEEAEPLIELGSVELDHTLTDGDDVPVLSELQTITL